MSPGPPSPTDLGEDRRRDLVSVVIPTRNRWALLARALASVLGQQGAELEVVVVDEGSTDETPARLAALTDERVRVLRNDSPTGVANARNRGIDAARGEWVAFLDDDDFWAPDKIRSQLDGCAAAGADFSYTGLVTTDAPLELRRVSAPAPTEGLERALLGMNVIGAPSSVMVRRSLLERAGGFDPDFSILADWDLYIRLSAAGRPAACEAPLTAYLTHPTNMHLDAPAAMEEFRPAAQQARGARQIRRRQARRRPLVGLDRRLPAPLRSSIQGRDAVSLAGPAVRAAAPRRPGRGDAGRGSTVRPRPVDATGRRGRRRRTSRRRRAGSTLSRGPGQRRRERREGVKPVSQAQEAGLARRTASPWSKANEYWADSRSARRSVAAVTAPSIVPGTSGSAAGSRSSRSKGEAAERVMREAHAAARLNHPGIVTLYELGSATPPRAARIWSASSSRARTCASSPPRGEALRPRGRRARRRALRRARPRPRLRRHPPRPEARQRPRPPGPHPERQGPPCAAGAARRLRDRRRSRTGRP